MGSHGGIDVCALSQSFPQVLDAIILLSDKRTQLALRLTCHLIHRHVDDLRCRQLEGSSWYFAASFSGALLIFVCDDDEDPLRGHHDLAFYHWEDTSVSLPGLRNALTIHAISARPAPVETFYNFVPPRVTPILCHRKGVAYYPLDNCWDAVIEVDTRGCCCNPSQPVDYRIKASDVTIEYTWEGRLPKVWSDTTDCNLLKQVFHPGLERLRLVCSFGLLWGSPISFPLPKPAAGFQFSDSFKVTIAIYIASYPSTRKSRQITDAFAELLGVNETQVDIELIPAYHLSFSPDWSDEE